MTTYKILTAFAVQLFPYSPESGNKNHELIVENKLTNFVALINDRYEKEIANKIVKEVENIRFLSIKKLIINSITNSKPIPEKYNTLFPSSLFPFLSFLIKNSQNYEIKLTNLIFEISEIKEEIEKIDPIWKQQVIFCLNEGIFLPYFFSDILPANLFPKLNCFINYDLSKIKTFKVSYQNNPYSLYSSRVMIPFFQDASGKKKLIDLCEKEFNIESVSLNDMSHEQISFSSNEYYNE